MIPALSDALVVTAFSQSLLSFFFFFFYIYLKKAQ